jgi:hypothetical protein
MVESMKKAFVHHGGKVWVLEHDERHLKTHISGSGSVLEVIAPMGTNADPITLAVFSITPELAVFFGDAPPSELTD